MSFFSYQNKRRIKTIVMIVLAIVVIVPLLFLCRCLCLAPHLVYTPDGVVLDYDLDANKQIQTIVPVWDESNVTVIIDEPVSQTSTSVDMPLQILSGSYITTQMLLDMDSVQEAVAALPTMPDTVMLDLKSIYGNFYYSSDIHGAVTSSADIPAVNTLIKQLSSHRDLYLIARVASLSDTNFALEHQECGLPLRSGALWMSSAGCYWLDPMNEDVQEYLVAIATELAGLGFDEIVFDDFRIPTNTEIIYNNELTREKAAATAAEQIRERLQGVPIRVSFNSSNPGVAKHSDRVYLVTEDGSAVAGLVESVADCVDDPAAEIVFLTPSRDTRFDGYGILRPMIEPREE